ncbi:MAG: hypothetical protein AAB660_01935 [Patescibacteria group bacterium]
MPTTKKRLNLTLDEHEDKMLSALSRRERKPKSAVALAMLREMIEVEEDKIWVSLAEKRIKTNPKWISHKVAWKGLL